MLELMLFKFLICQLLTSKFVFHNRSDVAEREISVCPAWLCALVGFLCFVMLVPGLLLAQTEIDGEASGVWDVEGSPYIILEGAVVPFRETLEIAGGVEVRFRSTLNVHGNLFINGTEEDSVFWLQMKGSSWMG